LNEVAFAFVGKCSKINENMKRNYHAIALDKIDIGEADRLYTFYTLENGLIRVPARSVRKGKAKLAMQVEDFVLSHITIAQGYGRGTLAGAVAEDYFVSLHENFLALECVDNVRTVFLSIIDENECDKRVFMLLVAYLEEMNKLAKKQDSKNDNTNLNWCTHAFLIKLFCLQGYDFHTHKCSICNSRISEVRNGFSVSSGGVLCVNCSCNEYFCYIDPDTLKALRVIKNNNLTSLLKVTINEDVHKQLKSIVYNIEKWVMR